MIHTKMDAKTIAIQYASKKVRQCIPLMEQTEDIYTAPAVPYDMTLREVSKKNGFILSGTFSLPHLIVDSVCVDNEGKNGRQWIKLSTDLPDKFSTLKEDEFLPWLKTQKTHICTKMGENYNGDNEIWLSRNITDWRGNAKKPMRIWKPTAEGSFKRYTGPVSVGDLVVASCDEIRGYMDKDNMVGVCMELNRDLVLVKKHESHKRRKIAYFSDTD